VYPLNYVHLLSLMRMSIYEGARHPLYLNRKGGTCGERCFYRTRTTWDSTIEGLLKKKKAYDPTSLRLVSMIHGTHGSPWPPYPHYHLPQTSLRLVRIPLREGRPFRETLTVSSSP